jgi:hypothetical protein
MLSQPLVVDVMVVALVLDFVPVECCLALHPTLLVGFQNVVGQMKGLDIMVLETTIA